MNICHHWIKMKVIEERVNSIENMLFKKGDVITTSHEPYAFVISSENRIKFCEFCFQRWVQFQKINSFMLYFKWYILKTITTWFIIMFSLMLEIFTAAFTLSRCFVSHAYVSLTAPQNAKTQTKKVMLWNVRCYRRLVLYDYSLTIRFD